MEVWRGRANRVLRRPSLTTLAAVAALLIISDWLSQLAGDSVIPGGPLDETAHLMTMVLVLWACGARITQRYAVPALIISVAIDADHIPQHLGFDLLTVGTPRPYTHSLTSALVLLLAAAITRRPARRRVFVGLAVGLVVHLWRDLSEPGRGVSLLWPLTDHAWTLPHASYLAVIGALVVFDAARIRGRQRAARHAAAPVTVSA